MVTNGHDAYDRFRALGFPMVDPVLVTAPDRPGDRDRLEQAAEVAEAVRAKHHDAEAMIAAALAAAEARGRAAAFATAAGIVERLHGTASLAAKMLRGDIAEEAS